MATFEEELLQDEQEKQQEIAFIRKQLPLDLKDVYTDEQLSWMLDTIVDYYFDSGILESDDDVVDIDLDEVSAHLCQQASKEGMPSLQADEVRFVVEADLDFQEQSV